MHVTDIIFFVSELVDCARWFDVEVVLSSFITPFFARYLRKISSGTYGSETIVYNTADYILRAVTLKQDTSVRVTLPDTFTWLK